jgi:hypothetical protein
MATICPDREWRPERRGDRRGHIFVLSMRDGYPINLLGRIKDVRRS